MPEQRTQRAQRTQVAIIGGGPSGLLLGQLLHAAGIDTVVLERQTREHVLSRIRAGVVERGMADLLRRAVPDGGIDRNGLRHDGVSLSYGETTRIDLAGLAGRSVIVYGQTEITRDLYAARDASGAPTIHEASDVAMHGVDTDTPRVTYRADGAEYSLDCDFVAGCDGFHGVSRDAIPSAVRREFSKSYPFGWLGVLSETPPVSDELVYANSERGFALCSMRNPGLSRYYVQCPAADRPESWTDDAFWDELRRRIPESLAESLVTGPSIEKSVAPIRSFVAEPIRYGNLFLCGDAAHIVPPTGAKGLNSAAADVHYLNEALVAHYASGDDRGIEAYSARALARVWKVERFSWWMTSLTHRFPGQTEFDLRLQRAEFETIRDSEDARREFARNYVGLPY